MTCTLSLLVSSGGDPAVLVADHLPLVVWQAPFRHTDVGFGGVPADDGGLERLVRPDRELEAA